MNRGKGTTHRPSSSVERIALAGFLAEPLDRRFTIPGTSTRFGLVLVWLVKQVWNTV
jgi:hypothetical protein